MKESNPKQAFGDVKPPISTVSAPVMYELGLAMLEGSLKYGRHNYRVVGVRMSTYYDAAMRHLTSWWEGEDIDEESGMPHLVKAMACLCVVRDAEINSMVTDDRPPSPPEDWQRNLKAKVAELKAKYPDPVDPFTRDSSPREKSRM